MITAYLRISTDKQDAASQRSTCNKLASELDLTIGQYLADTASGGIAWRDRALGTWLDAAQAGDILIVSEVSRIARSLTGILTLMEAATARGIKIHCASPRLALDGSIQSQTIAFAFGIAAQIERDLLRGRTRAALAERKARGITLGRPIGSIGHSKLDKHRAAIEKMLDAKCSMAAIGRTFGATRQTVAAFIQRHDLVLKG